MEASTRRPRSGREVAALRVALALLLAISVLPGCGGGGASGSGGSNPLAVISIQTTALPSAAVNAPYSAALAAHGGEAPYHWSLTGGSTLPQGLSLSASGSISGTPTVLGTFVFGVSASDSASPTTTDTASYSILVTEFDASVALLHAGDAWTGESYPLSAIGGSSTTFTLVQNESGAVISGASPATNTASYVPGALTGTDVVRAVSSQGGTEDLSITVVQNPVANFTASFSTTDVWHLRFEGKYDSSHGFDSDYHAALSDLGLRAPTSTSSTGTTADELADLCLRRKILANLSQMYLNAADGSPSIGGMKISFPFVEPDFPHVCPANGSVTTPAANQFNVVSLIGGGEGGVIGTAYLDSTSNVYQENNTTTSSAGELGVFVIQLGSYFSTAYHNTALPSSPVGSSDVAALKAILYGQANPGGRYTEIKRIVDGFGKTVAAVAAHEIGHSLGLDHTSPAVSGSIMNASAVIGPGANYSFIQSDLDILAGDLPGPGRGGSPAHVEALRYAAPGEGEEGATVVVCACKLHRRGR